MKNTIIAIIVAFILIIFALFIKNGNNYLKNNSEQKNPINNVSIVDGVQIIKIQAKGGYLPAKSRAQAGVPTILRFNTIGTFDCSSFVRIPSLNITKNLPQSGITDIDLSSQPVGTLNGSCGMGMYPFEITFS